MPTSLALRPVAAFVLERFTRCYSMCRTAERWFRSRPVTALDPAVTDEVELLHAEGRDARLRLGRIVLGNPRLVPARAHDFPCLCGAPRAGRSAVLAAPAVAVFHEERFPAAVPGKGRRVTPAIFGPSR